MPSTEIDRLTVVWDANFAKLDEKLNKVIRSNYGAAARVEKAWNQANDNIARKLAKSGVNQGLDAMASRAPAAAGALTALGTAGLVASAALGTFAVAASRAIDAMAWGDELQTAADKIQITAEELQELQFAADEVDVSTENLRSNLERLNASLGALKTGIGAGRVKPAFAALGITRETVADVRSANDLLPILADRLGQVRDTATQVQIAKRLGIEDLLPLLRLGADGLAKYRDRARELGLVLSNDTVRALAEADREMELAGQQIQANLRVAFSGLAVDIAKATAALAEFLTRLRNSPSAWRIFFAAAKGFVLGGPSGSLKAAQGAAAENKNLKAYIDRNGALPDFPTAADMRALASPAPPGFEPTIPGEGDKDADKVRRQRQQVALDIMRAELDVLDAHNDERRSIDDRLVFSLDRLALQKKIRDAELDELERQYQQSKGKEGISAAERKVLEAKEAEARAAEERKLKERAFLDNIDLQLRYDEDLLGYRLDELSSASSMADTLEERRRIALEVLAAERRAARKRLSEELSRDANLTPEQRQAQIDAFDRASNARTQATERQFAGPIEDYLASIQDLSTFVEGQAVGAFRELNDTLAQSAAKALGLKGPIGQLFASILSMITQRTLGGAFSSVLGAVGIGRNAKGTDNWRGGPTWVGERGKELVNLPKGAQVIPNDVLRALAGMKVAPASVARAADFRMTLNLEGANGDETIRRIAYQAAFEGAAAARSLAVQDAQVLQARKARGAIY